LRLAAWVGDTVLSRRTRAAERRARAGGEPDTAAVAQVGSVLIV